MFTQHPPFTRAEPSDPFYRLICANRTDLFWKAHSKNKPEGFFSEEFKNLISQMLAFDPAQRLSMEEIKAHPWYDDANVASLEDVQAEFDQRKQQLDIEAEKKRQEKQAEKQAVDMGARAGYRGAHRGDGEGEESKFEEVQKKELEEYVRIVHKNTEFFSTYDADTLFTVLAEYS